MTAHGYYINGFFNYIPNTQLVQCMHSDSAANEAAIENAVSKFGYPMVHHQQKTPITSSMKGLVIILTNYIFVL